VVVVWGGGDSIGQDNRGAGDYHRGSREKCDGVTRLGADLAVNYREQNFVDEAKTFTSGAGSM
jgi:NADPH:quinone reductase-like Zn-dependent oxidoreductase